MKLDAFDKIILISAFMSMGFSMIMWVMYPEDLTFIFIGLWVPSILGLGVFIKLKGTEDKGNR